MKLYSCARFLVISLIVLLTSFKATGQVDSIRGIVQIEQPSSYFVSVTVVNRSTGDFTISENYGEFTIAGKLGDTFSFAARGVAQLDTVLSQQNPMIILRFKDYQEIEQTIENSEPRKEKSKFQFTNLFMGLGGLGMDFKSYDHLLDSIALSEANNAICFNYGIQGAYKNFDAGFSMGFNYSDAYTDSLDYEANYTHYSLSIGYRFFDYKRFVVRPNLNFHLVRSRLIVSHADQISIDQYLQDRSIDLRWQQYFVAPSIDAIFRLNNEFDTYYPIHITFNSIGLSGGVIFPLHRYPILRSTSNLISNKLPLDLSTYYFEVTFNFLVPHKK